MVISYTKSLCPECLRVIEAKVVERDNKIYLQKKCLTHGEFETPHVLDIPRLYKEVYRIFYKNPSKVCPHDLIIYVNSRCNQNCPICYSNANDSELSEPSIDEIMSKLSRYSGVWVHLSGGEPTLREDLFEIIRKIKSNGFRVGLFTNGKKLINREYVYELKRAGLGLIILQFDTLDDSQYEIMRSERLCEIKLQAMRNIRSAGIYVYLFSVLIDGINSDQIGKLVKYSMDNIDVVKILNFNPVWHTGRYADFSIMPHSRIYEEIKRQLGLDLDDFIEGTEFAHCSFEIYRKLINKNWTRQPPCAQRCYMIKIDNQLIPLAKIINLKRWNYYLSKINSALEVNTRSKIIYLFFNLPYLFILKEFFFNNFLLKLCIQYTKNSLCLLFKKHKLNLISLDIFSLMIGVFHNEVNADLDIVKKCTLSADIFSKSDHTAACMRQIYHNERLSSETRNKNNERNCVRYN